MFRELACTVKRDNLTHDFLLNKTPGPIARCAFFLREKLFDAVIIQRGHVVGTRSHARKFNERPMRRQRSPARLSLVSSRSEVETSLDGCERNLNCVPPCFTSLGPDGDCAKICPAFDCGYFVVGKPAAFQALQLPAIERAFLYPIFFRLS